LLLSYNLYSTVNFPTRIHNNSVSAIDNIFIDKVKYENYSIHPLFNGLSDHDAQLIAINSITVDKRINKTYKNIKLPCSNMKIKYTTPKEIEKIIKLLKSKNCHGYDEIPTKILKVSTPFITSPLTYICNKSL